MAESEENKANGSNNQAKGGQFGQALSLINQAVSLLRESSSNDAPQMPCAAPGQVAPRSEMSRLFPFLPTNRATRTQRSTSFTNPRMVPYARYKPKETWTHMFVCLADKGQDFVPSREQKTLLKEAGLGERRMVFGDKNGAFPHVKSVLEKAFPKLKDVDGGFEILRSRGSGARRSLEVIQMPPLGYTVSTLTEALGQAIGYLRPLQKNLDMNFINKVHFTALS